MFLAQDARNKEITSQVESIQQELASLSMVEMTKTNLKVNIEQLNEFYVLKKQLKNDCAIQNVSLILFKVEFENEVMKEKREQLTAILVQLMDQKKERQEELTSRLKEMENSKSEEHDNYWLIQYQKLLDNKPKVLERLKYWKNFQIYFIVFMAYYWSSYSLNVIYFRA